MSKTRLWTYGPNCATSQYQLKQDYCYMEFEVCWDWDEIEKWLWVGDNETPYDCGIIFPTLIMIDEKDANKYCLNSI